MQRPLDWMHSNALSKFPGSCKAEADGFFEDLLSNRGARDFFGLHMIVIGQRKLSLCLVEDGSKKRPLEATEGLV